MASEARSHLMRIKTSVEHDGLVRLPGMPSDSVGADLVLTMAGTWVRILYKLPLDYAQA